jgi:hypothetical protein
MTQHQGTLKWGPHIGSHPNVLWYWTIVVHKKCKDHSPFLFYPLHSPLSTLSPLYGTRTRKIQIKQKLKLHFDKKSENPQTALVSLFWISHRMFAQHSTAQQVHLLLRRLNSSLIPLPYVPFFFVTQPLLISSLHQTRPSERDNA